jgi:predicted nucleic acid-binding protein
VLIAKAEAILDDLSREFVASDMLRLEILPKAHFHGRAKEAAFYEDYFNRAIEMVETTPVLVRTAETEAKAGGLSAIDALHVTAAKQAGAEEFITAELSSKPIFRVQGIQITSLRS